MSAIWDCILDMVHDKAVGTLGPLCSMKTIGEVFVSLMESVTLIANLSLFQWVAAEISIRLL